MNKKISLKMIRYRSIAEITITLVTLPYFLIDVFIPLHILEFIGGLIVSASYIHNFRVYKKVYKFAKTYPAEYLEITPQLKEEIANMNKVKFEYWYIIPTTIGMIFIYSAKLARKPEYTLETFYRDLIFLAVTSGIGFFLCRSARKNFE